MTITLTREEAQQVLNALEQLYGWDTATQGDIVFDPSDEIEILRARIAQPETSYETGQRLYREGKGISFIPTAVERDDQIGEALRGFEDARLAQPEPEPVAWFMEGTFMDGSPSFIQVCETDPEFYTPLYRAPQREWQGLTDEEKKTIYEKADAENWHDQPLLEAVEAKLKEKNT
jgi:hypothetical protein